MAEEGATLPELEGFDQHLERLSLTHSRRGPRVDSRRFCSEFCELVERFCLVRGGPAPQLRVLEVALCYFFRASSFLPPRCDHVHHTLSSLALSVFELLLFIEQKDFVQEALQPLTLTFQESHLTLARHPNAHLLWLHSLIHDGGPWGNPVLLAILHQEEVSQSRVDGFLASEPPLFQELRVRYLLSVGRGRQAAALAAAAAATAASARPSSRQRPFFLQVHLASLCKTDQKELLHREVSALGGAELLQVICGAESQEDTGVLLCLCRAALRHLLHTSHTHCLRQLVCVWAALHRRHQTSRPDLLEESRRLLQLASHCTAIFPFIRVLLEELGDAALPFCVELCSGALGSGLASDSGARALVHKVVAGLLPQDLEVCRACALLVFFHERSLEAYRTVVRLYSLPDQEYQAENMPIGNHVRFDLLQVLKKDMVFDPEFWNVVAIRSHCQKLLSGDALRAAKQEASEVSHRTKKTAVSPLAQKPLPQNVTDPLQSKAKKRHQNGEVPKGPCRGSAESPGGSSLAKKSKRTPSPRDSGEFLRRSFWQPGRTNERLSSPSSAVHGEPRRITRFSEKNRPKRRIRTPRWLLEDSGTMEMNAHRKVKKLRGKVPGPEKEQDKARALVKRSSSAAPKTSAKEHTAVKRGVAEKPSTTGHLKGLPLDYHQPTSPARVILELSLPDNDLSDVFADDSRENGPPLPLPPAHQYKAPAKAPCGSPPHKSVHRKRVVIRATDGASLARQLHSYACLSKQAPASVVTRSSTQALPAKGRPRLSRSKPLVEMKVTIASQAPARTRASQSQLTDEGRKDGKPGTNTVEGAQRSPGVHNAKHSPENVGREIGHLNACKGLATVNAEGVSDSITAAPAEDSQTTVHIAGNDDIGGHQVEDVTGRVVHGVATARASDIHGRCVDEDLHGLRLLSETVSALTPAAPQSVPVAPGEATEEQSLHARRGLERRDDQDLSRRTPAPSSPPGAETAACALSKPTAVAELARRSEEVDDRQSPAQPESADSRLEYRCTLCNKLFRGRRLLVHATFHSRRAQCMFCGVPLKDDRQAATHLSGHMDKLRRQRGSAQNGPASESPPASPRVRVPCPSPVARGQRRPVVSTTETPRAAPETAPSESRRLRSDSGIAKGTATRPKVNGHVRRKRPQGAAAAATLLLPHQQGPPIPEDQKDKRVKMDNGLGKPPQAPKQPTKRLELASTETCCPVAGCPWQAELSRSPLALLYHALEEHHRDNGPLELAFQLGKGQCSVCLRVLWSFQHYLHHVERHRLTPRHPCLHQGCGARFRTGNEMRRHSRKHRPLQAGCCIPGCSELFICLWALNLHEREHYAGKATKSPKACLAGEPAGLKMKQVAPAQAVRTPMRGKDRLGLRDQTPRQGQTVDHKPTLPDCHLDPCAEVTTGDSVKGNRPALRRSRDSTQVEDVQVCLITKADSHGAFSHKLRQTPFRQQAKQMHSASPSAHGAHSRRRRTLENGQVESNVICKKTVNHHRLSKTAIVQNCFGTPKHGRFVEEEQYQKSNMVSTSKEHSAPMASKAQEQLDILVSAEPEPLDILISTEHEQLDIMVSEEQEPSAPLACLAQEHSAPTSSKEQEQSDILVSTEQGLSAPMSSTAQEQLDIQVSTAQEQLDIQVSTAQEQLDTGNVVSTGKEQSDVLVPTEQEQLYILVSTEQEPSAPLACRAEEESAPTSSEEQEQSEILVSTEPEQSEILVSTEPEQSEILVSTEPEQSEILVSTEPEQSGILVSTEQEPSAPLVSTEQEQSDIQSAEQELSDILVPTEQEPSAPLVPTEQEQLPVDILVSTEQEQSEILVSTEQEAPSPTSSKEQKKSAPLVSTKQEQLSKTQVSKNNKRISASPSNSDSDKVKKGRVARSKRGLKSTEKSTCNSAKPDSKTPSKTRALAGVKTTKGVPVARATKELPVATAPKAPLTPISTEATAIARTTEAPQGANVAPISEVKQGGSGGGHLGYSVLINGGVSGKPKAADAPGAAPLEEAPAPSYPRRYFRLPPTTYLDERFTNMPKRRKHMSMFRSPPKSPAPAPASRPTTRCPSCFVSFSHEGDLQEHLRNKRCSSMFGFDSDEDNS